MPAVPKQIASHGLVKEDRVPPKAIDWAIQGKRSFEVSPALHTYEGQRGNLDRHAGP